MENKYKNSKIYKLIDNTNGNIYIGSTIQTIEKRLIAHRKDYKRYLNGKTQYMTSFEIIKNEDYKIELIELYPCINKRELELMEGYYIRTIENCINKCVMGRSIEEMKEYMKEYRELNKDKIKEQKKEYRKQKYNCICGSFISRNDKSIHLKSKKHIKYINNL